MEVTNASLLTSCAGDGRPRLVPYSLIQGAGGPRRSCEAPRSCRVISLPDPGPVALRHNEVGFGWTRAIVLKLRRRVDCEMQEGHELKLIDP